MPEVSALDLGQSALSAFRAELPIGGRELTAADNDTLTVATLLRHATVARESVVSRRMIRRAARIAKQVLGKRRLRLGVSLDTPGYESPLDVFRMLGEWLTGNGKPLLEDHMLASLERLAVAGSLTAGRLRARRVIVAWNKGEFDVCEMQAEALFRGAQASPHEEVRLRGGAALVAIVLGRGNVPEGRRIARRVLREAGDRYPQIIAVTWENLGVVAARARNFDEALRSFWKAYNLTKGVYVLREQVLLGNICRALLDTGHPAAARAGFARLLSDGTAVRSAPIWLGGFAVASGELGDSAGVAWATAHVLRLAKRRSSPRELADGLLECSVALAAVGQDARAGTLRRRSLRLAERYGFGDLIIEAQPTTMRSLPSTSPLTGVAKEIAARVTEMEPETLPTELVYAD